MHIMQEEFDLASVKLKYSMRDLWGAPQMLASLEELSAAMKFVYNGYSDILHWISEQYENHESSQKVLVIKKLVVFNFCTEIFQRCITIFEMLEPHFRDLPQVCTSHVPHRRLSCSDQDRQNPKIINDRCEYERMLSDFAQLMQSQIHAGFSLIPKLYDGCGMFKAFWVVLQQMVQKQDLLWCRDRQGRPYRPTRIRKANATHTITMESQSSNYGVPSWHEDEELRNLFQQLPLHRTFI